MVEPLCTVLIIAWLSLVGSKHKWTVPFSFGTTTKLLEHSVGALLLQEWLCTCPNSFWTVLVMHMPHPKVVPGMVVDLPRPVIKMCLWSTQCLKNVAVCVVQFWCYCGTCHDVNFLFLALQGNNHLWVIFAINWHVTFQKLGCFGLILLRFIINLSSIVVSLYFATIKLSCHNLSQSSIPKNIGPFPGTTKKLYKNSMPLWVIATLHMPICNMHKLLSAYNTTILSMYLFNSTTVLFGESTLNILIGIRLPLLPLSILYSHIVIFATFCS